MTTEPTPLMRAVAGAKCAGSGAYRQRGADGALYVSATPAPGYAGGWVESSGANPTRFQSTRSA